MLQTPHFQQNTASYKLEADSRWVLFDGARLNDVPPWSKKRGRSTPYSPARQRAVPRTEMLWRISPGLHQKANRGHDIKRKTWVNARTGWSARRVKCDADQSFRSHMRVPSCVRVRCQASCVLLLDLSPGALDLKLRAEDAQNRAKPAAQHTTFIYVTPSTTRQR